VSAGTVVGRFVPKRFYLRHCPACRFSFVENPLDPHVVYDQRYYKGRGADPLVDYTGEVKDVTRTIRVYEWRGIARVVAALTALESGTRWLDFGCGTGGLVRHIRNTVGAEAWGFEQGEAERLAASAGTPLIRQDELVSSKGSFDVITAIEVVEHMPRPVEALREMRKLVRPGGLLFLTTGNALPYRGRIEAWRYVIPEIHVSFFEPTTLAIALTAAGFEPAYPRFVAGYTDIIRFKILKNLGRRRRSRLEAFVPWSLVASLVDWRLGVSAHPVGWARNASVSASAPGVPMS
jgi:SAM-dependent methyltransferase